MATAILDIELESLPPTLSGLDRYARALILIRWHSRPVAQVIVPVTNGTIDGSEARQRLIERLDWPFWEHWLHEYLEWEPSSHSPTPMPATIAICTHDRPDDVRRCLEAVTRLPDDGQELLLIDNAPSTTATQRLCDEYDGVRYVREERVGLNIARNRALVEASYDIVAFTDDDATPDRGWLRALLRNFHDPSVLCVTGLTMPIELETTAQEAFERYTPFGRGFRRNVFDGMTHDPLSVGRVGAGANMALRRSVLNLVGPFDEALDGGTVTRTGGDHEMFSRILAAGYRIVYDPAALSWHRHRRSWDELRRTIEGYGSGVYAMWTRSLLLTGEWGVLKRAWDWFAGDQAPALVRSILRRPGSKPLDLVWAELRGCAMGPLAYFSSRDRVRRASKP